MESKVVREGLEVLTGEGKELVGVKRELEVVVEKVQNGQQQQQ